MAIQIPKPAKPLPPEFRRKVTEAATRTLAQSIAQAAQTGQLPHEFLLSIMRGEPAKQVDQIALPDGTVELVEREVFADFDTRVALAKELLPYFAPKLTAAQINIESAAASPAQLSEPNRLDVLAGRLVDLQRRVTPSPALRVIPPDAAGQLNGE